MKAWVRRRDRKTPETGVPRSGKMPHVPMRRLALAALLCLLWTAGACSYMVTIKSDPPGAAVTDVVHGSLGETPCTYTVKRGESLHLQFTKEGYWGVKQDLVRIKSDATVMASLRAYPTLLFINSIPAGATLRVYDAATGQPVKLVNPSKIASDQFFTNRTYEIEETLGEVNVLLEKKGYKPLRHRIKIEPFIENRFSFELEQIVVKLRVSSDPPNVNVYERSRGFIGRTPLDLDFSWEQLASFSRLFDSYDLDSVDLHLTFEKEGYAPKEVTKKVFLYHDNPALNIVLDPAEP